MISQFAVARRLDFKRHWGRYVKHTPPRRASCVDLPRQTCKVASKFTWLANSAKRRLVSTEGFTKCCRNFESVLGIVIKDEENGSGLGRETLVATAEQSRSWDSVDVEVKDAPAVMTDSLGSMRA